MTMVGSLLGGSAPFRHQHAIHLRHANPGEPVEHELDLDREPALSHRRVPPAAAPAAR
jgi:hypothetical protein